MRAVELFKKLECIPSKNRIETSFGNPLAFVKDDSIKAYVFKKGGPTNAGNIEATLKKDLSENKELENYAIVGKLIDGFSLIKNINSIPESSVIQINTYAEAGEQEPFDLLGDTTGIVDISWYGFWSREVYRHSFSTACCGDSLGNSIDKKKKFCACCGRKIDYDNVIKKELHETA